MSRRPPRKQLEQAINGFMTGLPAHRPQKGRDRQSTSTKDRQPPPDQYSSKPSKSPRREPKAASTQRAKHESSTDLFAPTQPLLASKHNRQSKKAQEDKSQQTTGEPPYLVTRGKSSQYPGKTRYIFRDGKVPLFASQTHSYQLYQILEGQTPPPTTSWKVNDRVQAMANYIQIATTPTVDSGPSLILHFDHRRYLFGHLSEGTQRAITQRKISLAKLETMFLSGQSKWTNTGGMLGMMLTVADVLDGSRKVIDQENKVRAAAGKSQLAPKQTKCIEIHGARNLAYSIATARGFIFRKGMPIRPKEVNEDPRIANPDAAVPDFEDDAIQVWKIPVVAADHASAPSTSRKRSHEVMTAEDEAMGASDDGKTVTAEQAKINLEGIHAVVEDMFNSTWTADTLYETKLHDVELPATIFVRKDGDIQRYEGPMPGDKGEVPNIDVLVRYPWPSTKVRSLPLPATTSDMSVCYVVKNRGRRGKFNPAIAKEHGVAVTDFKLLTQGKTVKGKDGVEVTPEMVLEAPMKPNGFAIIDIPGISSVDAFLARPEWNIPTVMVDVPIFYWLLGQSVVDDARIQNFMRDRPDVRHVVMAPDVGPNMLAMDGFATLSAKLRLIDPERYPIVKFNNEIRDLSHIGPNVVAGRVGMKTMLAPAFSNKDDEILPFPSFEQLSNMPKDVARLAKEARAQVENPKFQAEVEAAERDIPNRDTEIIPLGTGSALPSKYRNVSSTLIRVPQYGNYLLDCGENSIGQLRRAFSAEEATEILRNLRCIVISHMHADHHLGTAVMLGAWVEATAGMSPPPIMTIVCPYAMQTFLYESKRLDNAPWDRLVFRRPIAPRSNGSLPADDASGLSSCILVPVTHCKHAYACVLTWDSGLKIAYSGDCRPSAEFAEAGKGATLLIHESTFDDDKKGDAIAKRHSTMSEALQVAQDMGARRVLLTHFSQRYAKAPIIEKRRTNNGDDQAVLLAFDLMRVKLGQFRHAQAFLPATSRFFELEAE